MNEMWQRIKQYISIKLQDIGMQHAACCTLLVNWFIILISGNDDLHGAINQTSHMTGNIVKGVTIPIASYPYFALILYGGQVHCGGSIVSSRVILTANHCIDSLMEIDQIDKLVVALGADDVHGGTRYKVCNARSHPDYDVNNIINDIGLLLLRKKIKFETKVQQARLINDLNWRDKARKLSVIGYGTLETAGRASEKLQMTVMKYVSNDVCGRTQSMLPEDVNTPSTMFCMIGERWTSDCYGDSGSPISWRRYVVGLVNVGRGFFCASDMMPSMYLDVYKYRDWISKNVKKLEKTGCKKKKRKSKRDKTRRTSVYNETDDPTDWLT